jgi:glycogen phosphorylase
MDNPRLARQLASAQAKHTGGNLPRASAAEAAKDGQLEEIKRAVLAKLALNIGKDASAATERDWFVAAAVTIRDRIVHRWLEVDRAIMHRVASASTICRWSS